MVTVDRVDKREVVNTVENVDDLKHFDFVNLVDKENSANLVN